MSARPAREPKSSALTSQVAAPRLVEAGELDGALALSLVVWSPKKSRLEDEAVPLGRQFYAEDVKAEIRRRHAAGETLPTLAASTGIPFGTCHAWCSKSPPRRRQAVSLRCSERGNAGYRARASSGRDRLHSCDQEQKAPRVQSLCLHRCGRLQPLTNR